MPFVTCTTESCHRRFRGKHALRNMHQHVTFTHKKQPQASGILKTEAVRVLNSHLTDNVVADEKIRVATDFIWRALSTQQRCELLGSFFIQQSTAMRRRMEELRNGVIDSELVDETRDDR
jgi:hypothetical protein